MWIVDPANHTLEIYTPQSPDTPTLFLVNEGTVTSQVLPKLNFELATLFDQLPF